VIGIAVTFGLEEGGTFLTRSWIVDAETATRIIEHLGLDRVAATFMGDTDAAAVVPMVEVWSEDVGE
jgi:hypothetical protein